MVAEVETEVAEEFIVVRHVRRAPDLHGASADMLVAAGDRRQRVGALHAAVGRVGVGELEAEVGKPGVGQRQADVGRRAHLVAIALIILAPAGFDRTALGRVAQHKIQHAGYRVGAVLGTRAVAQHFYPFKRDGRDRANVGAVCPLGLPKGEDADGGRAVSAFAVDQHQGRVRGQSAHLGRADQGVGVANGVLGNVIGRNGRGQQVVQVADAVILEVFAVNDVHRHRRIRRSAAQRAGADHSEFLQLQGLLCLLDLWRTGLFRVLCRGQ